MKHYFLIAALIPLSVFIYIKAYFFAPFSAQKLLSEEVLRIHVIAHDDTNREQCHKLMVRDQVLSYFNAYYEDCTTKEACMELARLRKDDLEKYLNSYLRSIGNHHTVSVRVTEAEFPDKVYGDLYFPSGTYDALQIIIGEGNGHNWWCILFPGVCIPTAELPDISEQLSVDNNTPEAVSAQETDAEKAAADSSCETGSPNTSAASSLESSDASSAEASEPAVRFRFRYLTFLNQLLSLD